MTRLVRPLGYLVTALLIAGAIAVPSINRDGGGEYGVTAYFEKAIGLFPNSDVTILGVAVGKITAVEPEGTTVRVEMTLSDDYQVPADAFAQIVPISVISDRYVQLAPPYQGGPALEDGAVIPQSRTQIPAELDDVFKQLKKLLDAIQPGSGGEPGALGELIVQLNDTLSDREADIRGTLVEGAQLTSTLAGAGDDLAGLLRNLDSLFTQLETRASSFGTLNANMANVFSYLAASRQDLEGTLANLANLTNEVGDLVRDHDRTLAKDLKLAGNITSTVLDNKKSVQEALAWLPVASQGISGAYHGGDVKAVDVRDNASSARCDDVPQEILDLLPADLKDQLCGSGGGEERTVRTVPIQPEPKTDCVVGVKRVKRQLRKISRIGIDEAVRRDILKPLKKKLKRLGRKCDELEDLLNEDPGSLIDEIIEDLGGVPNIGGGDDPGLFGSASGANFVPTTDLTSLGLFDRVGGWLGGFFGFLGGRS